MHPSKPGTTVADIIKAIENIAPAELAEEWDNVGLQVGKRDWIVKTVWIALDPLPEVVAAACKNDVDLLITHHPLIFQPIRSLDFDTPMGSVLQMAAQHRTAVLSVHTNLDTAADGLNDALAGQIGLKNLKLLGESKEPQAYKLVLHVPAASEQSVLEALFHVKSGDAGTCISRSFQNTGTGIYRTESTAPRQEGKTGGIGKETQVRIEAPVRKKDVYRILRTLDTILTDMSTAYDLYPLLRSGARQGLGRIGELEKGMDLISFAGTVKRRLGLKSLRVVGSHDLAIYKAAVCTGSGSSLLGAFFSSNAQVFITGDLRYHDARAAEAAHRALIDIGHFSSEQLMIPLLAEKLRKRLSELELDVSIETCGLEKDPFMII